MSKTIAFCGLSCEKCPTYLATKTNDDEARKKTAEMYAVKYGFDLEPKDINCDGCHSDTGILISYCQTCEVRKCGRDKGVDDCTYCNEQPCGKLISLHRFSPAAKAAFEAALKMNQ